MGSDLNEMVQDLAGRKRSFVGFVWNFLGRDRLDAKIPFSRQIHGRYVKQQAVVQVGHQYTGSIESACLAMNRRRGQFLLTYVGPRSNVEIETMFARPSSLAMTSDAIPLRIALKDPDDARPEAVTTWAWVKRYDQRVFNTRSCGNRLTLPPPSPSTTQKSSTGAIFAHESTVVRALR